MGKTTAQPDASSDRKLRELALFIAQRCEMDPAFGATKLNKLLFFADFLAYKRLKRSITGQEYVKLDNGPAPRRMVEVVRGMLADGDAVIRSTRYFDRVQKRLLPLREPDMSDFSVDDVVLVTQLIQDAWGLSAREISAKSHHFIGWKLAKKWETIPYEVALVQRGSRSEQADQYASTLEPLAEKALVRRGAAE
ncbi:MAG: Panacea domain-containing protein [Pirellulales bacterium]